jgi:hypothetical protein
MSHGSRHAILPAICVGMVLAADVRAVPRGEAADLEPQTPEQIEADRVETVAAMDVWLRRLVGHYSYTGTEEVPPAYCITAASGRSCTASRPREARGVWDCVAVGAGAGVHCVFGSTAPLRIADDVSSVADLNMDSPTMILFGIDPDVPTVRYMRIDEDGIASEATGDLKGNTVVFRKPCTREARSASSCLEIFKIEAPENRPAQVTIDWVDAGADYNSVALLQLWLRSGGPGR